MSRCESHQCEPGCGSASGFCVVLFQSVQHALAAEKLLAAADVDYKLIAVPRHISSNCGFCIRIKQTDQKTVAALLSKQTLGVETIQPL